MGLIGVTLKRLSIFLSLYSDTTKGRPIKPPAQIEMVQSAPIDCSKNVKPAPSAAGLVPYRKPSITSTTNGNITAKITMFIFRIFNFSSFFKSVAKDPHSASTSSPASAKYASSNFSQPLFSMACMIVP